MTELVDNIFVREGGDIEIHMKCKDAFLSVEEFIEQNKNEETNPKETA